MMDLAELRINRMLVSQNSKCEGCVHYDGNAAAKGGVCEVGQSPMSCGNGSDPKYGYAPLTDIGPDELDDLATPTLVGSQGAMNEHGDIEPMIAMKRVVLGDEDLSIAKRIHGELQEIARKSIGYAQGQVNAFSGAELAQGRFGAPQYPMVTVAKSLYDYHLSPRERHKYGVTDVLAFLKSRGMPVTDEEMEVCKSRFGPTRQVAVGHADNPTLPQAAANLRSYNAPHPSANSSPHPALGKDSAAPHPPNVTPLRPPRNRTPTQPMPVTHAAVAKALPDVKRLETVPFVKRR